MTDEAYCSVVLALLPVNFYEKCNDQGLDPRGWPFSCLPDFKQIVVTAVITSSPPACTSSAGMLSTPADFPFFSDCTAASTSLQRMGWSSSVSDSSVLMELHRHCDCKAQSSILSIGSVSVVLWGIFINDLGQ